MYALLLALVEIRNLKILNKWFFIQLFSGHRMKILTLFIDLEYIMVLNKLFALFHFWLGTGESVTLREGYFLMNVFHLLCSLSVYIFK
jgi:hypothetical protein